MRISDWSSDVCSSDLVRDFLRIPGDHSGDLRFEHLLDGTQLVGGIVRILNVAIAKDNAPFMRRVTKVVHSFGAARSEDRRGGKEGVSTCRSRWSPYH